jgi:hypothetical protein
MRGRPIISVDDLRGYQSGSGMLAGEGAAAEGPRYLQTTRTLPFVISAVSSHGARELIRKQLQDLGYVEMQDFICAA